MKIILIGHNAHLIYGLLLIIITLTSCDLFSWDEISDCYYNVYIENQTSDTLKIYGGTDTASYTKDSFYVNPYEKVDYYDGFSLNKGEDPIRNGFFHETTRSKSEQIRIYINNKLVINWIGPPREMGDTIHHFFNYNSWVSQLNKNGKDGIIQFTIYESDLKSNTE